MRAERIPVPAPRPSTRSGAAPASQAAPAPERSLPSLRAVAYPWMCAQHLETPAREHAESTATSRLRVTAGTCHAFFAFDVAQAIDLEACARRLRDPARRVRIAHQQRAPAYFQFEPAPLRVIQEITPFAVGGRLLHPRVEVVLYDFGGISLGYAVPCEGRLEALVELSCALQESEALRSDADLRVRQILDAIGDAAPDARLADVTEDYLVFQIEAFEAAESIPELPGPHGPTIARVLRAERGPLSTQEVADALAAPVAYGAEDVSFIDWNGALVFAREADDVRAVLEFANVQLAEMRFLDGRLDDSVDRAYATISARWARIPFRSGLRELTRVARMQVEGAILFERVSNALKLLGDPYLARVYLQAARRFRLAEWNAGILRKLTAIEGIYAKLSDAAGVRRMELLEWIIILLIAFEVALPFLPGFSR